MDDTHSEIINDQGSDCSLEGKTKRQHVKIPKRKIIIEPVLMIAMVFAFPFMQVSQLFIYSKLEDYTAHKTGYNLSHVKGNNSLTNCDINKSSSEYVFVQEVQKYNSYFNIILSLCSAFPSFFVMLCIGGYSDKRGRKYIILLPLIGGFFQTSIYLLVIALNLPVWSLWIADFIYGCCGGFKLLFVGCFTYLADITTKEQRLFRITMAELSTFLAGILGPIGIGYWIQQQGYAWPMLFSVSGHILNIIYTIFFVPETIVKDPAVDVKFFSLSHFKHTANVFTRKTADNRRWKLWVLFITFSIQSIAFGTYEVKQLFMLNIPLCWGAVMIGYYSTVSIAVSSIFGMVAAKVLKYCMSDSIVALISAGFCTVQYLYTGFVKNTIMMFICKYAISYVFQLNQTPLNSRGVH